MGNETSVRVDDDAESAAGRCRRRSACLARATPCWPPARNASPYRSLASRRERHGTGRAIVTRHAHTARHLSTRRGEECVRGVALPLACEHGRRRGNCLVCSPHLICEHGTKRSNCLGCSPQVACAHGREGTTASCARPISRARTARESTTASYAHSISCGCMGKERSECLGVLAGSARASTGGKSATALEALAAQRVRGRQEEKACAEWSPRPVCEGWQAEEQCVMRSPRLTCEPAREVTTVVACGGKVRAQHGVRRSDCMGVHAWRACRAWQAQERLRRASAAAYVRGQQAKVRSRGVCATGRVSARRAQSRAPSADAAAGMRSTASANATVCYARRSTHASIARRRRNCSAFVSARVRRRACDGAIGVGARPGAETAARVRATAAAK